MPSVRKVIELKLNAMNFIKKILCRRKQFKPQPKQLRIDGVKATLTPTPDDAELAAQALLESRIYGDKEPRRKSKTAKRDNNQPHDAAYYRNLSEKIKESHAADARSATRFVAYCEGQLKDQASDFAELEYGLFKWQDTVEREGGELLKRWQKCLAECILRGMNGSTEDAEETKTTETTTD